MQAITDSKKKTLYIVSAFIGKSGYKKGGTQVVDALRPGETSKNATAVTPSKSVSRSADSVNGESGEREERFSLTSPVEETRNLIAVHNLTEDKLRASIRLGGLPMPSIAIVKRDAGHSKFSPISILFRRDTIDSLSDSWNNADLNHISLLLFLQRGRLMTGRIHKNQSQTDIYGENQYDQGQQYETNDAQFRLFSQIPKGQRDACHSQCQQQNGSFKCHTFASFL